MKDTILQALKDQQGGYLSGTELSTRLGVSRTAVWKHIKMLRQEGYKIDSQPKKGYRLAAVPDRLYPQEIRTYLKTRMLGKELHYFEELPSTNEYLKRLADQGAAQGCTVVSEHQTAGKGRLGRTWFSPAGAGIWCSVLLRPDIIPHQAPGLTLIAAVAVAEGIEAAVGIKPGIKWPNDILWGGRKLCGLLTEMRAEADSVDYIVLGFGLNARQVAFPDEVKGRAIALDEVTGRKVDRARVLAEVLNALEVNYDLFLQKGFAPVLDKWKMLNVTLNREVTLTGPHCSVTGLAAAVSSRGGLIIRKEDGSEQEYMAGEVTLREG